MVRFRFEDLEIWQEAIRIASILFKIANELEQKNYGGFLTNLGELE